MIQKFQAIEQEMNQVYLERKEAVRGMLVGLLARQHVVLLGPPGTGKSAMTKNFCSRIGGRYFKWLMMRTTASDELFGPVSLVALQNDTYKRNIAGKIPEADIVFLDEIWKANSAVLNSLLTVLNEREFDNDGQSIKCPLQFAVGASNEMPEDKQELGALWDRFLLRYIVGDMKSPRSFETLILGANKATNHTTMTMAELAQAQAEAEQVDVRGIAPRFVELRQKINTELNIYNSPRRWVQAVSLIKAHSWLEGRQKATDDDLSIMAAVLWDEPNQLLQVRQIIMALANPLDSEAQDLFDQATEVWQNAMQVDEDKAVKAGGEANAKLKTITKKLEQLRVEAKNRGRGDAKIVEALSQVIAYNREVVNKCLGIKL